MQNLWISFLLTCRFMSMMIFYCCCYIFANDLKIIPTNAPYLKNEVLVEIWLLSFLVIANLTFGLWKNSGTSLGERCSNFLKECVFAIIMGHILLHIKYLHWIKCVLSGHFTLPNRYALKKLFLSLNLNIIAYYVHEGIN